MLRRNFRPDVKTALMLQDRRRTQRHSVGCAAKIRFDATSQTRDCIVSDLSEDGVRLVAVGIEIPEEFVLLLDGDAGRTCRLVWRLDDEIGAEFTDSAEEGWLRMALDRLMQAAR
jgi:PilZ domain